MDANAGKLSRQMRRILLALHGPGERPYPNVWLRLVKPAGMSRSKSASISRAMRALAARGLIALGNYGKERLRKPWTRATEASLTPLGAEVARSLMKDWAGAFPETIVDGREAEEEEEAIC